MFWAVTTRHSKDNSQKKRRFCAFSFLYQKEGPACGIPQAGPYHCEQNCKPGSVFDSHLSTRRVAAVLQPPRERSGQPIAPIPVLLRIEFTATDSSQPSGALLPHLSTLTGRHRPQPAIYQRYISVALVLKSPSAGVTRYPCPMEPGLSSQGAFRHTLRGCPVRSRFS